MNSNSESTTTLLGGSSKGVSDDSVSQGALDRTRNLVFLWNIVIGVSFGIYLELYTDLCDYVINPDSSTKASLISTDAFALYSVCSFLFSPILATLSDSVGRKPLYVLAAICDTISGILCGLLTYDAVFVLMNCLSGAGDATTAIGCEYFRCDRAHSLLLLTGQCGGGCFQMLSWATTSTQRPRGTQGVRRTTALIECSTG